MTLDPRMNPRQTQEPAMLDDDEPLTAIEAADMRRRLQRMWDERHRLTKLVIAERWNFGLTMLEDA